jgi:hypothetical protein
MTQLARAVVSKPAGSSRRIADFFTAMLLQQHCGKAHIAQ